MPPHPKAKLFDNVRKLNLRPKLQLFAWKCLPGILPKRSRIRNLGIGINGNCAFCNKHEETLNHLFSTCELALNAWSTTDKCPTLINSSLSIIDWIDFIWSRKNWSNKIYGNPLEIFIIIL